MQTVERGFRLTVLNNRVVAHVGDADTASVALKLVVGSSNLTDALVMDWYSSPDGKVVAAGKSAVATLTGSTSTEEIMSSDFSVKGYPYLIGVVSAKTTDAGTLADIWVTAKRNTA